MARRRRRRAKNQQPGWLKIAVIAAVVLIVLGVLGWQLAPQVFGPIPTETPTLTPIPTALTPTPVTETPRYGYKVVNTFPHDRRAFTQGLVFVDGVFYEGTGLIGQSTLRKVEPETGEVLQRTALPKDLFGEGITVLGDKIYQLSWKAGRGFIYDKDSFDLLQEFEYATEGWGITHDGEKLIMSDGTSTLHFLDPKTLTETGRVDVRDGELSVSLLNELEYVDGEIFANVWKTGRIVRIDPETGAVTGWIDLTGILPAEDRVERVDVMNGIAYDAAGNRLFVTGKWWPKLFEIELVEEE